MFDYENQEMNMNMYGEASPPDYNLAMVTCPVLLYWGENDWLAHPKDVSSLAAQLPNLVASVRVRMIQHTGILVWVPYKTGPENRALLQ